MKKYMKKLVIKFYSPVAIFLMLITIMLGSCKNTSAVQENSMKDTIDFEIVLESSQSNFIKEKRTIIKDQEQLQYIFEKINSTQEPGAAVPEIDFSRYQMGFATMGELSSGGYTISVDRIEKTTENIIIHLTVTSPDPGDNVTTVMTSPFVLFKFEKQFLPVVFK